MYNWKRTEFRLHVAKGWQTVLLRMCEYEIACFSPTSTTALHKTLSKSDKVSGNKSKKVSFGQTPALNDSSNFNLQGEQKKDDKLKKDDKGKKGKYGL